MPYGTPDEWLFEDWQLIGRALEDAKHEDCTCYECDTLDALLKDVAHHWDCDVDELLTTVR